MKKDLQIDATIHCDLLIAGAGGAGLRCASEVLEKKPNTRIIALTKASHPQKSHTSTAQGGVSAVDPTDLVDKTIYHMFDTWKGSDCTADQNVIKKICESAWKQILWLENKGMHFSRNQDGKLSKRTFGGHTVNFGESSAYRGIFEADRTGKGIMDTYWGESLKQGIVFLNQVIVVELLLKENRCMGSIIFIQKEGKFVRILSKAMVLSTGGSGQVFKVTTNCRQNTGDGLAAVLKAGLSVTDPEAVQFHPTGIVGPGILASETLRSVGGILRNKNLEPFMEHYAPKMKDLAPRDLVARAIEAEIREKRGVLNPDHNIEHVWIDLRHLPDEIHDKQIPEVTSFFKRYVNLDPKTELCPVCPSNHYHMGGITTNEHGEVQSESGRTVAGLYAVGECAAASFHGFNRLGSNSILELITMGKFVANGVLQFLNQSHLNTNKVKSEKYLAQFSRYLNADSRDNIGCIRNELRTIMTEKVGVFRTEHNIADAIEALKELNARADCTALASKSLSMNQELIQRWELDNLLAVSMVICQAALQRKESRGAHFRDDYPERKDAFNYHTIVSMIEFGKVKLSKREIDMSLFNAKGDHYKQFDVIERKY